MYERSVRTGEPMVPVLYLDLDGTVRWGKDELGRFVNTAEDVRIFDEVPGLIGRYKRAGWKIVGVTNQGGVALGHMTLSECMDALNATNSGVFNQFDKIMMCTHFPTAEIPEDAACWCRKPRPGMIIEAALDLANRYQGHIFPPHLGLMVGDRPEDEQAAENAGLAFMWAHHWRSGEHAYSIGI